MKGNKNVISCLFLIASLPCMNCLAQEKIGFKPEQYRAIQWTTQNGLPNDGSNVMIKDSKGFLWIGSPNAELCRFDGTKFKKYIPDLHQPGHINSVGIHAFVEDSLNNIWIGTDKGLSRYDIKADTFSNFGSSKGQVIPFWSTNSHVYCLEPGSGFVAYDIHSIKRTPLLKAPDQEDHLHKRYTIFDDASNCLWMLEGYSKNPDRGRLLQISLEDGKSIPYEWRCLRTNTTHRHSAEAMQFDSKRNSIWINSGDGLLEFTLSDKQFHHKEAFNEYINLKDYERWVGIDIDKDGRIWLATHKGILIYDPETEHVYQPLSDPVLQKNTSEANLHIYCDRDGIAWTSNWMQFGIYELLPFDPSVKRYAAKPGIRDSLSNGFVGTIIPADKGKLWLGTNDGINIFDPPTQKFESLRENDLPGIKGKTITPVYVDTVRKKAWLYAGSMEPAKLYKTEMFEMDIQTRQCRKIIFRNGTKQIDDLPWLEPNMCRPYKNGLLVCADFYGLFEIKEGSLFADLVTPVDIKKMISGVVIEEERFAYLKAYNALPNYNFENKNGRWVKIPHLLDSLEWKVMIYNEKDQTHWVAFDYELVHYTKDFRIIKTYKEKDGYSGHIFKMIIDNTGNLWFVNSMEQVGRLNVSTNMITILSETDGYHRKDFDWSVPLAKDASGNLYFGTGFGKGNKGLDRINPERFVSVSTSSVYIRSLAINQKPFPLSTGVNNLEGLSLRYNQNTISIETGVIDFYSNGKSNIRYKLVKDGNDEDWQYGTANYTIRYDGLPQGNYTLVMQASNASNEFNGPAKILTFRVSSPFWATWWFRIIAFLVLVDSIYSVVRWRMRQKFKLQLERSARETQLAEMRQRAAELLQQKTELEMQALRAQMNPHFIFNSLNSINRFILQNNKTQASEYLTKFSKLVRLILQNSQASLITLESELEALELYLDLEALRFDHRFGYKISVPKELDIEVLKVPPLIIQPYTENAIWHGLMHKEDKGQLDIEVSEEGDHLYFKIADNGIGRKQAAAIASKSATKHKSMGLRITQDRIAMLQKVNGESPVKIIDLENADGSAAGTEVIIKMPVIFGD